MNHTQEAKIVGKVEESKSEPKLLNEDKDVYLSLE